MLHRRLGAALAGAAIAALASGLAVVASASTPSPMARVNGYGLPSDIAHGQVHLEAAGIAATVAEATAISLAEQSAGGLASSASAISAQHVFFSDNVRGQEQADGSVKLFYVNRDVWLVRFVGVPQPVLGPGNPPPALELNVVIDAKTGQYLEAFSYQ